MVSSSLDSQQTGHAPRRRLRSSVCTLAEIQSTPAPLKYLVQNTPPASPALSNLCHELITAQPHYLFRAPHFGSSNSSRKLSPTWLSRRPQSPSVNTTQLQSTLADSSQLQSNPAPLTQSKGADPNRVPWRSPDTESTVWPPHPASRHCRSSTPTKARRRRRRRRQWRRREADKKSISLSHVNLAGRLMQSRAAAAAAAAAAEGIVIHATRRKW